MATDPCTASTGTAPADRHQLANTARPEIDFLCAPGNLLITVPEAASLLRVSNRTVWRLMADPDSGFPEPRRLRGRTLLVRDELLAFLEVGVSR